MFVLQFRNTAMHSSSHSKLSDDAEYITEARSERFAERDYVTTVLDSKERRLRILSGYEAIIVTVIIFILDGVYEGEVITAWCGGVVRRYDRESEEHERTDKTSWKKKIYTLSLLYYIIVLYIY